MMIHSKWRAKWLAKWLGAVFWAALVLSGTAADAAEKRIPENKAEMQLSGASGFILRKVKRQP